METSVKAAGITADRRHAQIMQVLDLLQEQGTTSRTVVIEQPVVTGFKLAWGFIMAQLLAAVTVFFLLWGAGLAVI